MDTLTSPHLQEAVVLLNMGGPNHLHEVELFLQNMFNDPYILCIKNTRLRQLIAKFITKSRAHKSRAIYERIGGKSPIAALSAQLTQKLNTLDSSRYYTYAMRYAPPHAFNVLEQLQEQGFMRLTLFPMYPQYSTTTTLSSIQDALRALKVLDYTPLLSSIERFYTHPLYNQAIVQSIAHTLKGRAPEEFVLIFSVHGLPERMILEGDPYQAECIHHVSLLKRALLHASLRFKRIELAYQSKVGPLKWLEPSTEEMIERHRKHKILIYPLAFSIDNSETIYELQIQYRLNAERLAVREYLVCPCLNDQIDFAKAIIDLLAHAPRTILS
ncbi:ferrochelatase [Helicobacter baculiformis]|uniref:Ferrochelatase n=1 Tax=Helicobacter baculiformis TaxID=427351 RepID=A0ABV7ZIS0_9HELI|nr:ferrochelatase [Helicobacter baculiformis]